MNNFRKSPVNMNPNSSKQHRWWIDDFGWLWPAVVFSFSALAAILYLKVDSGQRTQFFITSAVGLATLFVIIVQAAIYRKQWDAMEKSTKAAEKALVYSQRAYVTLTLKEIQHNPGHALGSAIVTIQNHGNTPANAVIFEWSLGFRRDPPAGCAFEEGAEMKEEIPQHVEKLGVVSPAQSIERTFHYDAPTNNPLYSDFYEHRNVKFYIWGRVTYTDVFRDARKSRFAFEHAAKSPPNPCSLGNEAY